jgi:hypothetical protein
MTARTNDGHLERGEKKNQGNSCKGDYYQDNLTQLTIICAVLNTSFPLSQLYTYSANFSSAYHSLLLVDVYDHGSSIRANDAGYHRGLFRL